MFYDTSPGIAEFQESWPLYWSTQSTDFTLQSHAYFCFFSTAKVPAQRFYGQGFVIPSTLRSEGLARGSTVSADAELQAYPHPTALDQEVRPAVINTEEFLSWAQAKSPLQEIADISVAISNITSFGSILACTSEGRLFSQGRLVGHKTPDFLVQFPASVVADVTSLSLQPVYNTDRTFYDKRFIHVAAGVGIGIAVTDDNELWMAGLFLGPSSLAEATDFSNNSTSQPYFARRNVTKWYSSDAALQTNTPLEFTNVWFNNNRGLALSSNNKLFMFGSVLGIGKSLTSPVFHEIGGFVNSAIITNGGSGYTSNPTLTVSAPDNAYGVAPTFTLSRSGGEITGINITNAGWGYSSAPTLTISGGGGSGATATCELFNDTWKFANVGNGAVAGISGDGSLYTWGLCLSDAATGFVSRDSPVKANRLAGSQPGEYEKVAVNGNSGSVAGTGQTENYRFGAAIDVNGKVSIWGPAGITPDGEQHNKLTLLSTLVPALSDYTFVDAVCFTRGVALLADDGSVWTYGRCHESLGHGANTFVSEKTVNDGAVLAGATLLSRKIHKVVGSDVWTSVIASNLPAGLGENSGATTALLAVRQPEQFDVFGIRQDPIPPFSA
jgi:hypothetical protein